MKKFITLTLVTVALMTTLVFGRSPMPPTTPTTLPANITSGTAVTPLTVIDRDTFEILVPARDTAETLGYNITWNATEKSVTFTKDDKSFKATSGSNHYEKNGESFTLASKTKIVNDKAYIPTSFADLLK